MTFDTDINDFYVSLLTAIVTLNGVAIPLSYNIISDNLKPFLDKYSFTGFIRSSQFRRNLWISLFDVFIFTFPLVTDISGICVRIPGIFIKAVYFENIYVAISVISAYLFLKVFVDFSLMIYVYASNTEEVVFNQIRENVEEFLEKI